MSNENIFDEVIRLRKENSELKQKLASTYTKEQIDDIFDNYSVHSYELGWAISKEDLLNSLK